MLIITASATARSTSPVTMDDSAMRRRGKYTLLMSWVFPTRLLADADTAFAKNVHGRSAAKANSGYGRPSDGILAHRPKSRLNTPIVANGWRTAHRRQARFACSG